jgi:hypothetical protein
MRESSRDETIELANTPPPASTPESSTRFGGGQASHDVRSQEGAHLIAPQHPPRTRVRVLRGHRGTVRVRVVGQDNVRVRLHRRAKGQIQGAGFLRVGKTDGGEVRVRLRLFADQRHVGEPGCPEDGDSRRSADAVQRCQDDLQVPGRE